MTERIPGSSGGLPTPEQVIELVEGEFARAGFEVEDVRIDGRSRPPRIIVVADGDRPLDLETIADLSRSSAALLDQVDSTAGAYVLEVTSPGVDRPLTAEKHFRRARGRRVEVHLADGTTVAGRLGPVADHAADVVVRERSDWSIRRIPLADIRKAVVQVEFSPPSPRELELAGVTGDGAALKGTEAET